MKSCFVFAAGGTGGHIFPALTVARVLRARGHEVHFIGTALGMETVLVPRENFPLHLLRVGALKRVSLARRLQTLAELPVACWQAFRLLGRITPAAVFSLGGYAAGPVMVAARLRRLPVVIMEPNAIPGFTNRRMGPFVQRILLQFPETARFFPPERCEVVGVPIRPEFFQIPPKQRGAELTLLVTGGSRGSRTLNRAAQESWPLFSASDLRVRWIHQCGQEDLPALRRRFEELGLRGEVVAFIQDMPAAFAQADLVICRAGASTIAELAAAGRPAILVPFPYAADDHQRHNAEAFVRAGAGRMVLDHEMTGQRLFEEVRRLAQAPGLLEEMGRRARLLARPDATQRTVEILEGYARAIAGNRHPQLHSLAGGNECAGGAEGMRGAALPGPRTEKIKQ